MIGKAGRCNSTQLFEEWRTFLQPINIRRLFDRDGCTSTYHELQYAVTDQLHAESEFKRLNRFLGFDAENQGVYMLDSRGRNTSALVHMNLADQTLTTIAESDRVDIGAVLIDPRSHKPFAYSLELIRPEWHAIDLGYTDTIAKLNSQLTGGSQILAQPLV